MSQNSNSWDDIGGSEPTSNTPSPDLHDQGHENLGDDHGAGSTEEVLDIETTEKPKSKAGLYAAIALVVLVLLGVVAFIGSKVYFTLYPDAGGPVAADSRPLDLPPASPVMGDPAAQPAMPGGGLQAAPPMGVAGPAAPIIATVPPAGMAPSQPPAGGPGPSGPSGPTVPQASIAPVCGPDLSATVAQKDREIAALRAELDALLKKVAAAEKAAAARKSSASKAQSENTRSAAATSPKPAAKPAAPSVAKPAEAPAASQPQAQAKPVEAIATPQAAKDQDEPRGQLARFKLHAVYPNTGEFQSAHLIDRTNGRNVVVRVGDVIFGARVTRIDSDSFRVQTTAGEIR
jgi:hypothetical protein